MSILQTQISNHFGIVLDTSGFGAPLRYPILGLAFYLFTVKYFEPKEEEGDEAKKKPVAKSTEQNASSKERQALGMAQWLMFVHNVILCIFSFLTCVNTFPIVYRLFQTYGFGNALTNGEFEKLYDGKYGYWSHLFYLSKFYEFVDTWIVLSRGKKPLFLQVYHHTGAVLGMWLITITRGTCGYLFVVENSFIHTIMYFYYAMSVLGIQCKNKHFITMAQMIQFVVGTSVGVLQIWLYGARMRFEDKFSLLFNEVYVCTLFILFFQFYQQSYRRPKQVKQA